MTTLDPNSHIQPDHLVRAFFGVAMIAALLFYAVVVLLIRALPSGDVDDASTPAVTVP